MTKLFAAVLCVVTTTSVLAIADNLQHITMHNSNGVQLEVTMPQVSDQSFYSCFTPGLDAASIQFQRKFGQTTIFVDQYQTMRADRGGLVFTARLSANLPARGGWVHQVYTVSTQYARSCTVGGVQLTNEYTF